MPPLENERPYDVAGPRASALIESLRAFGYSPETAIADLIDNSLFAGARNIDITFYWDGPGSWVSIRDDGHGMDEPTLVEAMRPGSRNPLEPREPGDLGRFGLGLKSASFSQCRRLTVRSGGPEGSTATRCWDLDHVQRVGEWHLLHGAYPESEERLGQMEEPGTVVLWEHLDRIVDHARVDDTAAQDRFLEIAERVEWHLGMTFHRFLEGPNRLTILVNGRVVEPWDPFLTREEATQLLTEEALELFRDRMEVRPYVLPHHSRLRPEVHARAGGPRGWTDHQGFYVYRNKRLLVTGDWLGLGFRKGEDTRLARIQVDIPNTLDDQWQIDVRKSTARPPAILRTAFRRLAQLTRARASDIYRHRGRVLARQHAAEHVFAWERRAKHGRTFYAINREHPLVRDALERPERSKLVALLRLIEETVPTGAISLDMATEPDRQALPFEGAHQDVLEVMRQIVLSLVRSGMALSAAVRRVATMEPFHHFPELIAVLSEQIPAEESPHA